jgi:hypothetical protein
VAARKKLSNAFSTGNGGANFEAHVQASFVILMLTGGYAPCLPCCPISKIKLQGKIDGFDTDDLIVFVKDQDGKEERKLLCQVKHSIEVRKGSPVFGDVIQDAWSDFNNSKVFTKGKDGIALITGPLSATDEHNVQWLLDQAKHVDDSDEFFRNVQQANFSPPKSSQKLDAIKHHLKVANGDVEVSDDDLHCFLKHFHLLGYDLGRENGVVLSLLHSHISQLHRQYTDWAWSRVVVIVQNKNQNSGTITIDNLPEDLLEAFRHKTVMEIPEDLKVTREVPRTDWTQHTDEAYLSLALLIGSWNESYESDKKAVAQMLGISYEEWVRKAREILPIADSPLKLKNGGWKFVDRKELLTQLGSYILDQNIDVFSSLAVTVLQEADPAFELPTEERFSASIHGKVLNRSHELRKGIAEGLALLGNFSDLVVNCSQGKVENACALVLREILSHADWVHWGSINTLLPLLAEAAPDEFLSIVEQSLCITPCPFDALFSQEGNGITESNYMTGLLWALEGLAWDERYLVRVCVALGELASHDPGGHWANRPSNSLVTILLPWFPQTLASIEKRKVAVNTLINEWPDIAWNLVIKLLPGQQQSSSESYKPRWRLNIPNDYGKGVTHGEYWQQASYYAEIAVKLADNDAPRLSTLIDNFDNLPQPAFDQLIEVLSSQFIYVLSEEERLDIWEHLTKFTNKHRRFVNAKWALSDEVISQIEKIAEKLAPTDPCELYRHLFSDRNFELYDNNGEWDEQQKKLDSRRKTAIREVFQQKGVEGVLRFAQSVESPRQVGFALASVDDDVFERTFFPHLLVTEDNELNALVSSFVWSRFFINNWKWCDNIDKSNWTQAETGQFLAYLPFEKGVWEHASEWLRDCETEYWTRTSANAYQADGDLTEAIEKLIEFGRPYAAINCLNRMLYAKQPIKSIQCIRTLTAALSSNESIHSMDQYQIVELIKHLQSDPKVNQDDLFKVEWAYVPLLVSNTEAAPLTLEKRLANDPVFFCEAIRLIYRSKNENQQKKEPNPKSKAMALNAWRLLHEWKIPPGTLENGTFNGEQFRAWLLRVKELSAKSGHLEVSLITIGEVLIHAPDDPKGLWIHREIAKALNDREAENMRRGYKTAIFNSRGVHWVDPSGKPEKELAEQYRIKAEEVENNGFQRLAETMRNLADGYEKEAERVITEHMQELNE